MATVAEVLKLRELIDDAGVPQQFSDDYLSATIDSSNTVNASASNIWRIKASKYASLVDVTEGSSSRKLSSLYKQALEMANSFQDNNTPEVIQLRRASRTRAIERA